MNELARIVEALLFLSPEPVSVERLADAAEVSEGEVVEALARLREHYADGWRGVVLREVAGGFTLATDPVAEHAARRLLARPRTPPLTQAQAECLAIVAYLQPVSRPELARIRGVASESAVGTLLERGLIEECGRSRFGAVLYRTTELFQKLFGSRGPRRAARSGRVRSLPRGGGRAARAAAQGRRAARRALILPDRTAFPGALTAAVGVPIRGVGASLPCDMANPPSDSGQLRSRCCQPVPRRAGSAARRAQPRAAPGGRLAARLKFIERRLGARCWAAGRGRAERAPWLELVHPDDLAAPGAPWTGRASRTGLRGASRPASPPAPAAGAALAGTSSSRGRPLGAAAQDVTDRPRPAVARGERAPVPRARGAGAGRRLHRRDRQGRRLGVHQPRQSRACSDTAVHEWTADSSQWYRPSTPTTASASRSTRPRCTSPATSSTSTTA